MSHSDRPADARCANCGTALQGPFCHVCGQHGHNPLRSLRHGLEDVFESFWHLDGRIFRTLRDLLRPGEVASRYLAGERVRYIPPLRLFVVMSLLTFFIGGLTLRVNGETPDGAQGNTDALVIDDGDFGSEDAAFTAAATPEAVLALRADKRREFAREQRDSPVGPALDLLESTVHREIDAKARKRLRALGMSEAQADAALARQALPDLAADARAQQATQESALNRWIAQRAARLKDNVERINSDPSEFARLFFGALPGALLVLVPVFALWLKLLYLGSGRGYLEHLVVALYSHAFLLMALLAAFVLQALLALGPSTAIETALMLIGGALALWLPVYLLLMQKRVYRQGWPLTLLKYAALGAVHGMLSGVATLYALLAGLSS